MVSAYVISLCALPVAYAFLWYRALQKNILAAKQSGFHYVVSPVYFLSIPWIIFQEPLLPMLSQLPLSWTKSWLQLSIFGRIWHAGHGPFQELGTDTTMVVSSSANILWTCDAEIITQVMNRRHDFSKAVEMLGMLNIYGPTITASDGEEHRVYRKVAAPSFNDENHEEVWRATTEQTEHMALEWSRNGGAISNLNADSSKLALHVISKVFYGRHMSWKGENNSKPGPGHTLTYGEAIRAIVEHNGTIFTTPRPVINYSLMKTHKHAKEAFYEWKKYMEEMRDTTTQHFQAHELTEDGSLLENFVKAGTPSLSTQAPQISPEAILGNIFIFILAGHETSANALTIAITLLACRPEFQKLLQSDIDSILKGRDSTTWSYKNDFTMTMKIRVGALMKEVVRLYSVIPFLPKINRNQSQTLKIGDRNYVLPANTLILLNLNATHRNPKYYPKNPGYSTQNNKHSPLQDFYPDRWLHDQPGKPEGWTPPEGAYIPFSAGTRSCMGQRFAEVEFCAAITKLFSEYSVELACKPGELFAEALRNAEEQLSSGMGFEMALKMTNAVPLKLVKRDP